MSSSDVESISCAASILNGATYHQLVNGYGLAIVLMKSI